MQLTRPALALLAATLLLTGCGSSVTPGGDANSTDATDHITVLADEGAMFCTSPDGRRCNVGETCPAGDGCNTCHCQPNGILGCTQLDCIDAGTPSCRSTTECPSSMECIFDAPGCDTRGHCEPARECAHAVPFCGCDGQVHDGPCNGPDAPFVRMDECGCTQASDCAAPGWTCAFTQGCSMPRGTCVQDAPCTESQWFCGCDGSTYAACSANAPYSHGGPCEMPPGYDCDASHVTCRTLPPACDPGSVPSVDGFCYTGCVPFAACNPIACDPAAPRACPAQTHCDPTTNRCVL